MSERTSQRAAGFRQALFATDRRKLLAAALGLTASAAMGRVDAQEATPVATPVAATPVASTAPQQGGTLRLARPGDDLTNLNPAAFLADYQVTLSYLEPLVRPDPVTMAPRPWLAERWVWRDGGRLLTLHLRDDVHWQDGSPLTAVDAMFSYEVYQQDADSAVAGLFALCEGFEAVSETEVEVRFSDIDANWLLNAATLPVFSRAQYGEFWDAQAGARSLSGFDWANELPVGTGPWQADSLSEATVGFTRFADYWGEPAWADELVIDVLPGRRERFEAWASADSALLWPVSWGEVMNANLDPSAIVAAPAASVMFAAFNFANPDLAAGSYWSDLRVRQAASLALNRARYADEAFGGTIDVEAAGVVSQPWAHDPEVRNPERDLFAAQSLLAEAGWLDYDGDGIREDATGVPLRPVIIVRNDSRPELLAVLARVARDLFDAGIGASIEALSPDDFDARWIQQRTWDLIAYRYDQLPGFTDYDLIGSAWDIRSNPAGWNPGGYSNADADAAIADFLAAVSLERQRSALSRLQTAINDDLFGLWFGFPRDAVLVAPGIGGFQPNIAWQTANTAALWVPAED
ncbi:MAG: ABC transporter substrate-binding protein [Thermomicrobiales bacterium]